jgi:hypothetical protein
VLGFDPDELELLYAGRVTLECLGARLAAGHMFRPDLEHPALNDVVDLYRGLNLLPVRHIDLQASFITDWKRASLRSWSGSFGVRT